MSIEAAIAEEVKKVLETQINDLKEALKEVTLSQKSLEKELRSILKKSNPEEKLTIREAAEILKVEENTVREYCRKGKIIYEKMGGQYRIKRSEINGYLNRNN